MTVNAPPGVHTFINRERHTDGALKYSFQTIKTISLLGPYLNKEAFKKGF